MFVTFSSVGSVRKLLTGSVGELSELKGFFLLHVTWHLLYYVFVFQVRQITVGRLAMGKHFLACKAETATQRHGKRIL